jgi:hypothetical protein
VTKIQLRYPLLRSLTDRDAEGISRAHAHYGFQRIDLSPTLDSLAVEYDASRLSEQDVEHALVHYGLPIVRKWSID